MPYLARPAVRLYYERAGMGPPLLAINGSGSDLRTHPNMLDWPLKSSFDVVSYDHRGLGRSDPAYPTNQPSMADFGADALDLVTSLGWNQFGVLGVSFGGMVAQELAILAGPRVKRLVLACTSTGGLGGSSYPLHELQKLDAETRMDRHIQILDTRTASDPQLRDTIRAFFSQQTDQPPAPGFLKQLEARRHHDTWDRLPQISAPTLIAAGRYDGIAPMANAEAMAVQIPGAKLEVFEGGHGFFAQDTKAIPAIIEFLQD